MLSFFQKNGPDDEELLTSHFSHPRLKLNQNSHSDSDDIMVLMEHDESEEQVSGFIKRDSERLKLSLTNKTKETEPFRASEDKSSFTLEDDDLTLADKIASFEYIDETDVEDGEMDWSPFEKVQKKLSHCNSKNLFQLFYNKTNKAEESVRKKSLVSVASSPIHSELDIWSPTEPNNPGKVQKFIPFCKKFHGIDSSSHIVGVIVV